jgi:hypothetical protein
MLGRSRSFLSNTAEGNAQNFVASFLYKYIADRSILSLARIVLGGTAASHTCRVWGAVIF